MIGRGKHKLNREPRDEASREGISGPGINIKWTYNYFSVESGKAKNSWLDNLPDVLRKTLQNEQ